MTHWDVIFGQQAWGKYPSEELIRFVARNFYKVPRRADITLLELGCGPGANLWYAAREGFTVIGIDGSAVAIAQAHDRLDSEVPGWRGRVMLSDVREIPVADSTADAVIDNECVSCLDAEGARQAYAEAARILKPGGKLYARTFAEGCWEAGPLKGMGPIRFTALADIPALFPAFEITHTELLTISHENRGQTVREWVIHGVKHHLRPADITA